MPNCVSCGIETNGTYNNRFPVCFDCYKGNKLKSFLLSLEENEKEYYFDCPRIYNNWGVLIKAKKELKELEIEGK